VGTVIPYDSEKHRLLLDALTERYMASRRKMADRYAAWRKAEEHFKAYIPETEAEAQRRAKREAGKPQYRTLFIPYSYAMAMAAHTYLSSVFLARSPIFQYVGRHGQAEAQTQAVEAIVDYQVHVGRMLVPLYVWLMDLVKYGVGIVCNYWAVEQTGVRRRVEVPREFMGIPIPGTRREEEVYDLITTYEGNKLINVSPYDFIVDPGVSLTNFQSGEFCGRRVIVGWNEILRRSESGEYFNVDQISRGMADYTGREERFPQDLPEEVDEWRMSMHFDERGRTPSRVRLWEIVWELSPAEWNLGDQVWPEKWVFTVAEGRVIIGARPLGLSHGRFPYFVQTYEFDGYSHSSRGMLEITAPLSDVLNWLIDSRMANVRQMLNNQLIVDPSKINVAQLERGPGFIAQLLPTAYGTDPRTAFAQVSIADVTVTHFQDVKLLMELIQRVTGVTDNMMGVVYPGGRKTATEVRTATSFGINRLKVLAEFCSVIGWEPLAQVLLQNSQEMYTEPIKVRLAGDLARRTGLPQVVEVRPEDIAGFYDFVPVDGTMPIDRVAQAMLWRELLATMTQVPEVIAKYDIAGIFSWVAQLAGLRNITQFELRPDEIIAKQAQLGNLAPVGGGREARGSQAQGRAVREEAGTPILAGIPGLGPLS